MRAEVIQGTNMRRIGDRPNIMETRVYTNPATMPMPLPPGSTVADVLLQPEASPSGIDPEKLKRYWQVGEKLAQLNVSNSADFPFVEAIATVTTAAAGGGPVVAIAAAVVVAVKWLTGSRPARDWATAGPGVHAWFTALGPQAFLDWVRANNSGALASVKAVQECFLGWTVQQWANPLVPEGRYYTANGIAIANTTYFASPSIFESFGFENAPAAAVAAIRNAPPTSMPDWVADAYTGLGVDYVASVERKRNDPTASGFMMYRRGIEVTSPRGSEQPPEGGEDGAQSSSWFTQRSNFMGLSLPNPVWALGAGVAVFGTLRYLGRRRRGKRAA